MSRLVPFNRRSGSPFHSGMGGFYNMMDDFFENMPFFKGFPYETFKVDVQDKEDEYLVEAELPGVNKEQIYLDLNDGRLNISVNREEEIQEENRNYIHRERRTRSMSRSIYLDQAKSEGIKARLRDGVLSIRIPKEKGAQNRKRIEIE